MDFNPSKINALKSIPPRTPPPPVFFQATPIEVEAGHHIFGSLFQHSDNPNWPTSAQPREDPQINNKNKANQTEAMDNRQSRS
jgi:hypothetical protein